MAFIKRRVTKVQLLRARMVGWITLLGSPLVFGFVGISDWASTPDFRVTIFEQIEWYVVIPILAVMGFVLGCCLVRGTNRDLRNGDFEQDDGE